MDTTPPSLRLNGGRELRHLAGTPFSDPGAAAIDALDGPVEVAMVSDPLEILPASVPAVSTLVYRATDAAGNTAEVVRRVEVFDDVEPTISMVLQTGASTADVALVFGQAYPPQLTFTAEDPAGVVEDSFTTTWIPEFDPRKIGIYQVVYTAEDRYGNRAVARRSVTMLPFDPPPE